MCRPRQATPTLQYGTVKLRPLSSLAREVISLTWQASHSSLHMLYDIVDSSSKIPSQQYLYAAPTLDMLGAAACSSRPPLPTLRAPSNHFAPRRSLCWHLIRPFARPIDLQPCLNEIARPSSRPRRSLHHGLPSSWAHFIVGSLHRGLTSSWASPSRERTCRSPSNSCASHARKSHVQVSPPACGGQRWVGRAVDSGGWG